MRQPEEERRPQDRHAPSGRRHTGIDPAEEDATEKELLGDRGGNHGGDCDDGDRHRPVVCIESIDDRMLVGDDLIERRRDQEERAGDQRQPTDGQLPVDRGAVARQADRSPRRPACPQPRHDGERGDDRPGGLPGHPIEERRIGREQADTERHDQQPAAGDQQHPGPAPFRRRPFPPRHDLPPLRFALPDAGGDAGAGQERGGHAPPSEHAPRHRRGVGCEDREPSQGGHQRAPWIISGPTGRHGR